MTRLSLPHEHGGYLTLAGGAFAGVWLASDRVAAAAAAVCVAAAFFARGPLERTRPAAWDPIARAVYFALILGGALLAGWNRPLAGAAAAGVALALLAVSFYARSVHAQRQLGFETVGMGALGGAGGAIALIGGAAPLPSLLLALGLGAHAALSVPLVRSELRPRERAQRRRADAIAAAGVAISAALLALVGGAWTALALVPRAAHLGVRQFVARPSALQAGLRETFSLAAVVTLLLWVLR